MSVSNHSLNETQASYKLKFIQRFDDNFDDVDMLFDKIVGICQNAYKYNLRDILSLPKSKISTKNFNNDSYLLLCKSTTIFKCTFKVWKSLFVHLFTTGDVSPWSVSFEKYGKSAQRNPYYLFDFKKLSLRPITAVAQNNAKFIHCHTQTKLNPLVFDCDHIKSTEKSLKKEIENVRKLKTKNLRYMSLNSSSRFKIRRLKDSNRKKDIQISKLKNRTKELKQTIHRQTSNMQEIHHLFDTLVGEDVPRSANDMPKVSPRNLKGGV